MMRFLVTPSLAVAFLSAAGTAAGQAPAAAGMTFTKDVAPILQNHCQVCHRPDTFAPMSLLTYDEVRPWARAIKQKVAAREMPPWFIDRTVGIQEYRDDVSLTDAEIETIVKWVDGGAVQGDPAVMASPHVFPDETRWQFGQPDVVVSLPKDYIVPATGPDHWPIILIDPKLKEDRYIAGIQVIPTKGYKSIHHVRTMLVPPSLNGEALDTQGEEAGIFLSEYAVGKRADIFPEYSARLIQAGTKFSVMLHLHPIYGDKDAKDTPVNIALGLKLYPKGFKPAHIALTDKVPYGGVDIRPGDANARVDGYYHLTDPTRLLSWQPHMHNRGKYACIVALIPPPSDDKTAGLTGLKSQRHELRTLSCARFSFNWHLNYVYAEDSAPLLPAGTILQTMQWYDNSAANKNNTDPDALVTRGDRTIDEMGGAWISFYNLTPDEYNKEIADRKARQHPVSASR